MPSFADFVTGKYTIVTVSETAFYQSLADPVRWDGYIPSADMLLGKDYEKV